MSTEISEPTPAKQKKKLLPANHPDRECWGVLSSTLGRVETPPTDELQAEDKLRALLREAYETRGYELMRQVIYSNKSLLPQFRAFIDELNGDPDYKQMSSRQMASIKSPPIRAAFEYMYAAWNNLNLDGSKAIARKEVYRQLGVSTNEIIGAWLPGKSGVCGYLASRTGHVLTHYYKDKKKRRKYSGRMVSVEALEEIGVDISAERTVVRVSKVAQEHEEVMGFEEESVQEVQQLDEAAEELRRTREESPLDKAAEYFARHGIGAPVVEVDPDSIDPEDADVAATDEIEEEGEVGIGNDASGTVHSDEVDEDDDDAPAAEELSPAQQKTDSEIAALKNQSEPAIRELWPLVKAFGPEAAFFPLEQKRAKAKELLSIIARVDRDIEIDLPALYDIVNEWDGSTMRLLPELEVKAFEHRHVLAGVVKDIRIHAPEKQAVIDLFAIDEIDRIAPPPLPAKGNRTCMANVELAELTVAYGDMLAATDISDYGAGSPIRPDYLYLVTAAREDLDPSIEGDALIKKMRELLKRYIRQTASKTITPDEASFVVTLQNWDPAQEMLAEAIQRGLEIGIARRAGYEPPSVTGTTKGKAEPLVAGKPRSVDSTGVQRHKEAPPEFDFGA